MPVYLLVGVTNRTHEGTSTPRRRNGILWAAGDDDGGGGGGAERHSPPPILHCEGGGLTVRETTASALPIDSP